MEIQGIVPTLIIVRVGLGVSTQDNTVTLHTRGTESNSTRIAYSRSTDAPIRMQVQRVVHVDGQTTELGDEESGKHLGLYPSKHSYDNV
jgi:hypothetical protein